LKYLDILNGKGIQICETLYEFEIRYLIEKEFVKNAEDVLFRRTKIGIQFNTYEIHNTINKIISETITSKND
jgi:glycerol-3-phosphate dehydrogenase